MRITKLFPALLAGLILLLASLSCQTLSRDTDSAGSLSPATLPADAKAKPVKPTATDVAPAVQPNSEAQATQPPAAQSPAAQSPTAQSPTAQSPAPQATPTSAPSAFAPAIAKASDLASSCTGETCVLPGAFLLARPVGPKGRSTIDPSMRFGEYQRITDNGNHGVNFLNSTGTPVLAAADGVVVVAGDDSRTAYSRFPNILGNLVILKHSLSGIAEPVFTLYAHLSQVSVKVNDEVKLGQEIGLVGMSGSVKGSTLHFEVRLGDNAYGAARNPELWLAQLKDDAGQPLGALAGRVLDGKGGQVKVNNLVIERLDPSGGKAIGTIYLKPYSETRLTGLEPWEESFGIGDLPPGKYQITFLYNGVHQRVVDILPGKLTLVTFHL